METTINFITCENPSRQATKKGPCIGRITHNGILGGETLVAAMAAKTGFNPIQVRAFLDALETVVNEGIAAGQCVDLGAFQLRLALKGTFPAANAPYDPKTNRLEAYLTLGKASAAAVRGLSPVNVTATGKPILNEIGCKGCRTPNEIMLGERVSVNGMNIRIDVACADEGIWIEGKAGEKLAQAEIHDSDSAHAVCTFAKGSLAPGRYRLAVYTRDGGAGQVSAVRRYVRVVD